MKLTATLFDAETGELLPMYCDAYLRGDLARSSVQAVEDYLRRGASRLSPEAAQQQPVAGVVPVGLVQEGPSPRRHHRRLGFGMIGLLVAGASMAATHLPTSRLAAHVMPSTRAHASSTPRTTVLRGRLLNEQGQPLAGATVLLKGTIRRTYTDANGNYSLRVPAGTQATLCYSCASYCAQELATPAAPLAPLP